MGHDTVLHDVVLVALPAHFAEPGLPVVHVLVLVWVPPSHSTEQVPPAPSSNPLGWLPVPQPLHPHVLLPPLQPWLSVQVEPPQPLLQLLVWDPEPHELLHPVQPLQLVTGTQHDWVLQDWLWLDGPEQPDPHTLGPGLLQEWVCVCVPPPQDAEQADQSDQPLQPPLIGVQVHGLFVPPPS